MDTVPKKKDNEAIGRYLRNEAVKANARSVMNKPTLGRAKPVSKGRRR